MLTLWQDVRFGLRMLAKNPGFTVIAVLTLALGIGANTAIFSIVNAVLLEPLPFPDAQNLLVVYQANSGLGVPKTGVSYPNYLDWTRQSKSFEELAAVRSTSFALTGGRGPHIHRSSARQWKLLRSISLETIAGEDASSHRRRRECAACGGHERAPVAPPIRI